MHQLHWWSLSYGCLFKEATFIYKLLEHSTPGEFISSALRYTSDNNIYWQEVSLCYTISTILTQIQNKNCYQFNIERSHNMECPSWPYGSLPQKMLKSQLFDIAFPFYLTSVYYLCQRRLCNHWCLFVRESVLPSVCLLVNNVTLKVINWFPSNFHALSTYA